MKARIVLKEDYKKEIKEVIINEELIQKISYLVNFSIASGQWKNIIIPLNKNLHQFDLGLLVDNTITYNKLEPENLILDIEDKGDKWDFKNVKIKFTYNPINDIKYFNNKWLCLRGVTVEGGNCILVTEKE